MGLLSRGPFVQGAFIPRGFCQTLCTSRLRYVSYFFASLQDLCVRFVELIFQVRHIFSKCIDESNI